MKRNVDYVMENYVYTGVALSTLMFWLFYSQFGNRNFLLLLNAIYAGQISAISVIYGAYFIYVISSHERWNRGRQYVVTTGLQHLAYFLVVTYSITNRRYGRNATISVDIQLLLSRYVALIAGFLQLTAPDLGKPFLYGFSRKVLWSGTALGIIVALLVVYVQFAPGTTLDEQLQDWLGLGD